MACNIPSNTVSDLHLLKIDNLEKKLDALSWETAILHLKVQDKITKEEMSALIKMLQSPDEENHVVAKETIKNLIQTI